MPENPDRAAVRGSERFPLAGARVIGPVPADERCEVTVRVRRRTPLQTFAANGFQADQMPAARRYLTREQYAADYAADPADIAKVTEFARACGLRVLHSSTAQRSVFLSGRAADVAAAFGTAIEQCEYEGSRYRARTGPLTVPADLAGLIEGVFGIDDRPAAQAHFQRRKIAQGKAAKAADGSFTPIQLTKLYNFPAGLDGAGQCIAIIELGGGYRPEDLKIYFEKLGLPAPHVKAVSVDGGNNLPSTADSADSEVMLDIEVAAAAAPKALIVVYFAPNTDKGFLDAITTAIHDTVNKPSVVSISWGAPEKNWTEQSLNSFDQAFQTAAALGVTICCASGDNGSGDGLGDGLAHVDFPASSPNVLGCGGTKLLGKGTSISSETVWNEDPARSATGGGISDFFPVPAYQNAAGIPPSVNAGGRRGRGVPDVAGNADPVTGYQIRVDGQDAVIGGTSAVSPLWAGLIALLNQKLPQPVGFLNPLLYGSLAGTGALRDITTGNNGAYAAKPGWDACTGWGSPDGTKLLNALDGSGATSSR
jgi:kumamolisin